MNLSAEESCWWVWWPGHSDVGAPLWLDQSGHTIGRCHTFFTAREAHHALHCFIAALEDQGLPGVRFNCVFKVVEFKANRADFEALNLLAVQARIAYGKQHDRNRRLIRSIVNSD